MGFNLEGKTIGIIGTGKIGELRGLAGLILINDPCSKLLGLCTGRILAHGFRANVIGYDLYPNEAAAKDNGINYVSLDELFRTSDVISLHCPLTPQTKYIINEEVLKTTKPGRENLLVRT